MIVLLLSLSLTQADPAPIRHVPDPAPISQPARIEPAPTSLLPRWTHTNQLPRGYHAHVTTDGRVIVHADGNKGKAAPHAGVTWPWDKYYGPIPPEPTTANQQCPT